MSHRLGELDLETNHPQGGPTAVGWQSTEKLPAPNLKMGEFSSLLSDYGFWFIHELLSGTFVGHHGVLPIPVAGTIDGSDFPLSDS